MARKRTGTKMQISERALLARVNRRLVADDRMLKKCQVGWRWYADLGDYYCVDIRQNAITDKHVDLRLGPGNSAPLKLSTATTPRASTQCG
jgi:hypothetical protein